MLEQVVNNLQIIVDHLKSTRENLEVLPEEALAEIIDTAQLDITDQVLVLEAHIKQLEEAGKR